MMHLTRVELKCLTTSPQRKKGVLFQAQTGHIITCSKFRVLSSFNSKKTCETFMQVNTCHVVRVHKEKC